MSDIRKCVRDYLQQTAGLQAGDHVIAGLSGGADSVCLLALLHREAARLGFTLSAIHVHHGIRGEEADLDVEFCRDLCRTLDIPLTVARRNVPELARQHGESLEEAGRRARYQCYAAERFLFFPTPGTGSSVRFSSAAAYTPPTPGTRPEVHFSTVENLEKPAETGTSRDSSESETEPGDLSPGCGLQESGESETEPRNLSPGCDSGTRRVFVALAHHMDDQAETILLNLCRGTGIRGMSGIPNRRDWIIRPLLGCRRRELEAWLTAEGLSWREDATNASDEYTRNKIRHRILPYLQDEINSAAVEHIAELASQAALWDDFLEQEARTWLISHRTPEDLSPGVGSVDVEELTGVHPALRGRILHQLICEAAGRRRDITARHVRAAEELLFRQSGSRIDLPGGVTVRRGFTALLFEKKSATEVTPAASPEEPQLLWRGEKFSVYTEIPGIHPEIRIFPLPENEKIPEKNYTKWLDYDKINGDVFFRHRKSGDRLSLPGVGTRKLKSFMIDSKIPSEIRDQVVLMAEGSKVLWVVGYRLGADARIMAETRRVLEIHFPDF